MMRGPDGKPFVFEKVWITYLTDSPDKGTLGEGFGKLTAGYGSHRNPAEDGGKIGPEFTFGIYASKAKGTPNEDGEMMPQERQDYLKEYRAKLITPEDLPARTRSFTSFIA